MTGLVLKLGPKERVLINGVVIENGDRRGRVNILTPNAKILRLKDALHPNEVNTPVKRVCYSMQLVLSGDSEERDVTLHIVRSLEQLGDVFIDEESQEILISSRDLILNRQVYPAMKQLKLLLKKEESMLLRRVS